MYRNYTFTSVTEALPTLMGHLLQAPAVGSRAGRVHELTHVGITLTEPWRREVLTPFRKPSIAAQIAETMWVLAGRNDIEWLSHYLPRAKDFSDDGKTWRAAYGTRIRKWEGRTALNSVKTVDQLAYVVDTLRRDPLSRQAVISLWDPVVDTRPGKDIPCNDWINFSSRLGKLDMHVALRSNDAVWGWSGINAFEWSTLQEVVAGLLGIEVGALHFSTTSFHLYDRHWRKAEKMAETPPLASRFDPSPRFKPVIRDLVAFDALVEHWFRLEYDIRTGSPLVQSYVDTFPEPMLQSWLRVLQWWWSKGVRMDEYIEPLKGTALYEAVRMSVQPTKPESRNFIQNPSFEIDPGGWDKQGTLSRQTGSPFIQAAISLHNEKHAAYGDSWKKRGEMLGILANIARKIDRLGGGATSDETSADTAMDLMIYLVKYRVWLDEQVEGPIFTNWGDSSTTLAANELLLEIDLRSIEVPMDKSLAESLTRMFDELETRAKSNQRRTELVSRMLELAYLLARRLWEAETQDNYRGADVD